MEQLLSTPAAAHDTLSRISRQDTPDHTDDVDP
jgi:hypothetical protein